MGEYPVRANLELFEGELPAGTMSLDMVLRVTEKNERKERQDEGE